MSRWEERDRADAAMDEPVTITERQYRSLKRGATLGLCALILAVLGTGLAVWNFVAGPKSSQANPAVAAAPAESSTTQTAAPAPAPTPDSVRSATAPPPAATPAPAAKTATPAATAMKPVVKPVGTAHAGARHASRSSESAATARAQRSAMESGGAGQKPQTMQASDLISKPTPAVPSPAVPSPITGQLTRTAPKDTTGTHK